MSYMIRVSNGILTPAHRKKIGAALWVFLWLLDRTTKEQDGEGFVLGGSPITASHIGQDLGEEVRTVRDHLARLEDHGYIRRVDHGAGKAWGYVVLKSKKWVNGGAEKTAPLDGKNFTPEQKKPHSPTVFPPCNKERQYRDSTNSTGTNPCASAGAEGAGKPSDTRRKDFIEDLKTYREKLTGPGTFTFTNADGHNLDGWLKNHPKVSRDVFQACLEHRARSDINPSQEICRWIGYVLDFEVGPLDRYGKPKETATARGYIPLKKHGKDKHFEITSEISAALADRKRAGRVAGTETGDTAERVPESAVN